MTDFQTTRSSFLLTGFVILIVVVSLVGCQEKSEWPRVPLKGTVKMDGMPFSGSLGLRPESGVAGPVATTHVNDGVFAFHQQNGPVAGAHSAILMPPKTSRDQVSVQCRTVVPATAPFEADILAESPVDEPASRTDEPAATDPQDASAK